MEDNSPLTISWDHIRACRMLEEVCFKNWMKFIDAIIDTIRPIEIDGVESNLSAADIIRENDNYAGYAGNANVKGTMSRADAVMVLVKALSQAAKDPDKKQAMMQEALNQYSQGNIVMKPEGSFMRLLTTKGFESIANG